jgi:hypothetical protein
VLVYPSSQQLYLLFSKQGSPRFKRVSATGKKKIQRKKGRVKRRNKKRKEEI